MQNELFNVVTSIESNQKIIVINDIRFQKIFKILQLDFFFLSLNKLSRSLSIFNTTLHLLSMTKSFNWSTNNKNI